MAKRLLVAPIALLFVLGLAGCASSGGSSVSIEEEWRVGQQMADQVAQQVRFVNDPVASSYVRAVGERIHAQTPMANLPFTFHIVDDPDINAFSVPGGHVYVNRGLVTTANKADELASVLAHEISHNVARHVVKQFERQQQISAVGSILLGQEPGQLQALVAQIIAGGAMARFSRADEKEADELGLRFMTAAGYNPQGMVDMFRNLMAADKSQPGKVAQFFMSHPLTQDRINDIQGRIGGMASSSGLITDEPEFREVKNRLR
ncbi:MAG: M48 family metallopeptidase [Acidobacteriota bacterium]